MLVNGICVPTCRAKLTDHPTSSVLRESLLKIANRVAKNEIMVPMSSRRRDNHLKENLYF